MDQAIDTATKLIQILNTVPKNDNEMEKLEETSDAVKKRYEESLKELEAANIYAHYVNFRVKKLPTDCFKNGLSHYEVSKLNSMSLTNR
uniref:BRO1 domain-containing protein n=1 Tax=Parastrongyloides trichosuri TaxID=131310 RepID=A0A0N5A057_PARTI